MFVNHVGNRMCYIDIHMVRPTNFIMLELVKNYICNFNNNGH